MRLGQRYNLGGASETAVGNSQTGGIDRVVAHRFTSSSMSDSKWRKVFILLSASELGLSTCFWKFVDDDRLFQTGIPAAEDLSEGHLVDGRFQPFIYKEIEWVELRTSDVFPIMEALRHAGNFDCHIITAGLRIYGYR